MNQPSIIALIASIAIGLKYVFLPLLTPSIKPKEKAPVWQIIWEKVINFFNLDEAPAWRKILLRIIFSALIVTALGCGIYDTYYAIDLECLFFRGIIAALLTIASSVLVILLCIGAASPKETLTEDHFRIDGYLSWTKRRQIKCIIINCSILCLWLAVFVIYINIFGFRFYSISLSALITAGLCILLTLLGYICYFLFMLFLMIVISPIICYFKWLVK